MAQPVPPAPVPASGTRLAGRAVLPGPVLTGAWDRVGEEGRRRSAQATAARRLGRPEEQSLGIHYDKDAGLLSYGSDPAPFRFTDGHARLSKEPGLGVTIDEAAVRAADRAGHRWRNPVWRHPDGSLAEW